MRPAKAAGKKSPETVTGDPTVRPATAPAPTATTRTRVTEETHPDLWDEIEYWEAEVCGDDPDDHIHLVQEWWLELVDIDVFEFTFDRKKELFGYNASARDHEFEDQREAEILAWAEKAGGWLEATRQSPTLAVYDSSRVVPWDKVDGWHRMKLAKAAGHSQVWCLVGYVFPEQKPEKADGTRTHQAAPG